MFSKLWVLLDILKRLLNFWDWIQNYLDKRKKAKEAEKKAAHKQAVEDLKKAKTDEEFKDAQRRIVRNKP